MRHRGHGPPGRVFAEVLASLTPGPAGHPNPPLAAKSVQSVKANLPVRTTRPSTSQDQATSPGRAKSLKSGAVFEGAHRPAVVARPTNVRADTQPAGGTGKSVDARLQATTPDSEGIAVTVAASGGVPASRPEAAVTKGGGAGRADPVGGKGQSPQAAASRLGAAATKVDEAGQADPVRSRGLSPQAAADESSAKTKEAVAPIGPVSQQSQATVGLGRAMVQGQGQAPAQRSQASIHAPAHTPALARETTQPAMVASGPPAALAAGPSGAAGVAEPASPVGAVRLPIEGMPVQRATVWVEAQAPVRVSVTAGGGIRASVAASQAPGLGEALAATGQPATVVTQPESQGGGGSDQFGQRNPGQRSSQRGKR